MNGIQLYETFKNLENEELIRIVTKERNNYTEDAISIALKEIKERSIEDQLEEQECNTTNNNIKLAKESLDLFEPIVFLKATYIATIISFVLWSTLLFSGIGTLFYDEDISHLLILIPYSLIIFCKLYLCSCMERRKLGSILGGIALSIVLLIFGVISITTYLSSSIFTSFVLAFEFLVLILFFQVRKSFN